MVNPNIFLNQLEIDAIKSRLGQEPWKTAYNKFMSDNVPVAMNTGIQSVTYGGVTPPSGDSHDYYSSTPASGGERADYMAIIAVSNAVRDLGLAYVLTGDGKYANKAIQLINGWCVNSDTKMTPRWWYSGQNGQVWIELPVTLPGMFYGADLIWNYSGWSLTDRDAFKNWVSTLLINKGQGLSPCNTTQNYDSWRIVFGLAAASITDNQSEIDWCISSWKGLIDCQQDSNGSFYRERTRCEGGLAYSMFNLKAWTLAAEIARHKGGTGTDLYSYKTSSGKGLELGFDFHAPYVTNQDSWSYTKCTCANCRPIDCSSDANGAVYELAYIWKQKSGYINAVTLGCGRPKYDNRIMGPVTLTHTIGTGGTVGYGCVNNVCTPNAGSLPFGCNNICGDGGGGTGCPTGQIYVLGSCRKTGDVLVVAGIGFILLVSILKK